MREHLPMENPMYVNLLMTGNELMIGDITDSNSTFIAQQLEPEGFSVRRKLTVGDDLTLLIESLKDLAKDAGVLIVNGGLGPTVDDLTSEALATALNVPLEQHPVALAHLETWCEHRRIRLNAANMKQALLPTGCFILANRTGSAVGFGAELNGCLVLCTPGVPREMHSMVREEILPLLARRYPEQVRLPLARFTTFGIGESSLQQWLSDKLPDLPDAIDVGFRASSPLIELKLKPKTPDALPLIAQWKPRIEELISDYIIANEQASLQKVVVNLLAAQNKTIVTAESCTGGLIASQITSIAGASAVFNAGFVTYSNTMKQKMLGVAEATLQQYGAVSEAVVREMLQGALDRSGANVGIAVSGIAGPDGGTAEKPAGTVWIAWTSAGTIATAGLLFPGDRLWFQSMVAAASLDLIRRELQGITATPRYLVERAIEHNAKR